MAPIDLGPAPDTEYPDGSQQGSFDASGNVYEKQELLHRPHAFALMHGTGGAKVAFGQLQWRIDTFTLQFKQKTVAVTAHPDHSHSSHTTTDHQHTITSDSHDGHTHSSAGVSDYAKQGSGGNSSDVYDTTADSTGTSPQGSAYHHKHGGLQGLLAQKH